MKIFKKIFTVVTWSVLLFSCRSTETQKNANSEIAEIEEALLQNHDGSTSEYAENESAEQRKKNSEPAAAENVADSASYALRKQSTFKKFPFKNRGVSLSRRHSKKLM